MDKSNFLKKFVEEILEKTNKKIMIPVSIICNGYEFDFRDENLDELFEYTIPVEDLPDDTIIKGVKWYIKGWKYYEGEIDITAKRVKEVNKNNLKYLFKDNALPKNIGFCSRCGRAVDKDSLFSSRPGEKYHYKNMCEPCIETDPEMFYGQFEDDYDMTFDSDYGYDISEMGEDD
jgi:hypothetical protein